MLKNCNEFCEQHKRYQKFVDEFRGKTIQEAQLNRQLHVHDIEEKREIVKTIIKAQYSTESAVFEKHWEQDFAEEKFVQFGSPQGFRVIGTLNGTCFRAIIFDYHHQVYGGNEKFNDKCIKNNAFQPYYKGDK